MLNIFVENPNFFQGYHTGHVQQPVYFEWSSNFSCFPRSLFTGKIRVAEPVSPGSS